MKKFLGTLVVIVLSIGIFLNGTTIVKYFSEVNNKKQLISQEEDILEEVLASQSIIRDTDIITIEVTEKEYKEEIYELINNNQDPKRKFIELLIITNEVSLSDNEQEIVDILYELPDEYFFYIFNNIPFTIYSADSSGSILSDDFVFEIDYEIIKDSLNKIADDSMHIGLYNVFTFDSHYSNIIIVPNRIDEPLNALESAVLHEFGHALYFSDENREDLGLSLEGREPFEVVFSKEYTETQIITNYSVIEYYLKNIDEYFAELFSWIYSKDSNTKKIFDAYKQKYPNDKNLQIVEEYLLDIINTTDCNNYDYGQLYIDMLELKIENEIKYYR